MKNIDLYGFDISTASLTETAREIADRVAAGKRTAVFTPNPEMLERAICDRDFASLLRSGDILTPDGVGVCLAARLLCRERA
ncbi:MAG: glycosyltransferase, partial [Clostridia bacterium]|nr:glycosyltransferase [Clostridia bacterium]